MDPLSLFTVALGLPAPWEVVQERRYCSRNPKWGPSDFGCKKLGDGHGRRRPAFVLRPSRRALRSSLTLPRFPVLLRRGLRSPIGPNRFPPRLRSGDTMFLSAVWGETPAGPRHARARLASPELLSILSLHPRQDAPCALRDLRQDYP